MIWMSIMTGEGFTYFQEFQTKFEELSLYSRNQAIATENFALVVFFIVLAIIIILTVVAIIASLKVAEKVIDAFYEIIKKKTKYPLTYYYNLMNIYNTKDNKMEIFFTKLDPQKFLLNTKSLFVIFFIK